MAVWQSLLKLCNSLIGDMSSIKSQPTQRLEFAKRLQTGIGNLGGVQIQLLKLAQALQRFCARVVELNVIDIQVMKLRQFDKFS